MDETGRLRGRLRTLSLLGLASLMACRPQLESPPPSAEPAAASKPAEAAIFREQAEALGLAFHHFADISGDFHFYEIVGAGVALVDFDLDGDLDVYLVQGALMASPDAASAVLPPREPLPLRDRLFRNELKETGTLSFSDVTESSGIAAHGYGMGVAVGDVDGDGHPDLHVTNFGSNQLWHARGDGSFEDWTARAGIDDPRWSTSSAFLDYDADGDQDLFVVSYVDYRLEEGKACFAPSSARDYCGPLSFDPLPDRLFRNRGDGRFDDVTLEAGLSGAAGSGLGVSVADFNGDSRVDIYVANDGRPNFLWINQGDGSFRDEALLAGCAVNDLGAAEASMGVDAADFDGDGDEDLFMTHLTGESNTLYRNDGQGRFDDASTRSGLAAPSHGMTGFGTAWLDFDNDGLLDLVVVNGAVRTIQALADAGDPLPLDQPNQLFRNLGGGRFVDVTSSAGEAFRLPEVSRGAAVGDLDDDGDLDVVVTNNSGPVRLFLNESRSSRHWIGARVLDESGTRDLLGARVELVTADGRRNWGRVRIDGSYCSANDPRVHFGLGDDDRPVTLRVHAPDGRVEEWLSRPADAHADLRRGSGRALP